MPPLHKTGAGAWARSSEMTPGKFWQRRIGGKKGGHDINEAEATAMLHTIQACFSTWEWILLSLNLIIKL
ncbi:hypothetical protein A2U01_0076350, partial [Trifolium medium]|nr:hypothetical protein [Trifolium medium]